MTYPVTPVIQAHPDRTGCFTSCRPYEAPLMVTARNRLSKCEDVSPVSLAGAVKDPEEPTLPVLRKKDLLELFDTDPDLAGHDVDVSRYIRATDDRDVQVAWRDLGQEPPADDAPDLHRDELCSVPCYETKKLVGKDQKIWCFIGPIALGYGAHFGLGLFVARG